MIPGIDEILAMLVNNEIDIEQANDWIRAHLATAEDTGHLRDLFAGLAMQAIISRPESDYHKPSGLFARAAYVMADAMLEARAQ